MSSKENEIVKVVHKWSEKNDRWIYIAYNDSNNIIGLNFMQGNEYDLFKKDFCINDRRLNSLYKHIVYNYRFADDCSSEEILDKVIWTYLVVKLDEQEQLKDNISTIKVNYIKT